MPRNGAGTFSIPNTFTAGQVISSDEMDENFTDVAAALTGSLPRDGQAAMDSGAQIKADGGSAALPGVTFGTDPNTGMYSAGGDDLGFSTGGTKRMGLTEKGLRQASPVVAIMMPVGTVFDHAGATAPEYSVHCYGQAISRTTYSDLFGVISTTYGAGDGSTTFNVPDCRGRAAFGQDDMGGTSANRLTNPAATTGGIDGDTLGATGGSETHTLTASQLATHTHAGTTNSGGAHTHNSVNNDSLGADLMGAGESTAVAANHGGVSTYALGGSATVPDRGVTSSDGTHSHTFDTGGAGLGHVHNNVPPAIIFNKCIVTGVAN